MTAAFTALKIILITIGVIAGIPVLFTFALVFYIVSQMLREVILDAWRNYREKD